METLCCKPSKYLQEQQNPPPPPPIVYIHLKKLDQQVNRITFMHYSPLVGSLSFTQGGAANRPYKGAQVWGGVGGGFMGRSGLLWFSVSELVGARVWGGAFCLACHSAPPPLFQGTIIYWNIYGSRNRKPCPIRFCSHYA